MGRFRILLPARRPFALGDGEARKVAYLSEVKQRFLNGVRAESFVPKHRIQ